MEKIGDIKYSGRIYTRKTTEDTNESYFLVFDLGLRANSSPFGNTIDHKFELPISQQEYERLREQLSPSRGFLRLIESTLSLSQTEVSENHLRVNKAYLSAHSPETEEYLKRAERDLPGLLQMGIDSVEER